MQDEISVQLLTEMAAIKEQTKEIPQIRKDVAEIKGDFREMKTKVERNEDDIQTLEKRSDGWNVINSLGVAAAAVIAFLKGGSS